MIVQIYTHKIIELYNLNGWIIWYVDISTKLFKNGETQMFLETVKRLLDGVMKL